MSAILDRGSLLFASVATLAATFLLGAIGPELPIGFYTPLLVLAVFYAPGVLLLATMFGAGAAFRRDYAPLLTCTSMALAAVEIPFALAAGVVPIVYLLGPAILYFAFLMFFVVRTVFGMRTAAAAGTVALSWIPLVAAALFWRPLHDLLSMVASPFFLFFAWYYLGSEFSGLGAGWRRGQSFRRMMEASALNPHDGEAQYQIGLIQQQRRQYAEAEVHLKKAIEIDPTLTDAHFQLGRMAREQGRLPEALSHFQTVVILNERHNLSEVLRELGALYVSARQFTDARNELAIYTERRPYDPEGLFYLGQALEGLGETSAAREAYVRAVDADRTAPRYRRPVTAPWSRRAGKQLSKLPK
jgi:tetratricopeptide (TPR) repeat protein